MPGRHRISADSLRRIKSPKAGGEDDDNEDGDDDDDDEDDDDDDDDDASGSSSSSSAPPSRSASAASAIHTLSRAACAVRYSIRDFRQCCVGLSK